MEHYGPMNPSMCVFDMSVIWLDRNMLPMNLKSVHFLPFSAPKRLETQPLAAHMLNWFRLTNNKAF